MGRKISDLIPFLVRGLESKKYGSYLVYTDRDNDVFHLNLPRLTRNINREAVLILQDWYDEKGREDFDYTKAKQAMLAALKKSVYLDHVPNSRHSLIYRILKPEEVKEKRERLKDVKKLKLKKNCDYDSPSSVESGYSSYTDYENEESPSSCEGIMSSENLMPASLIDLVDSNYLPDNLVNAVNHDHDFGHLVEKDGRKYFQPSSASKNNVIDDFDLNGDQSDVSMDFEVSDSEWKLYMDDLMSGIPSLDDFSCEINEKKIGKVYKYKNETLVGENIIMTFYAEDIEVQGETNTDGIALMLDVDVLQKIQPYILLKSVIAGDSLQLFLKSSRIGIQ